MNFETKTTPLFTPVSIFRNRNVLLLFSGKIISQLWDQIYAFALSWYILDLTKSSFQMAIFLVINTLVFASITPFGGLIADRLNRKAILVWMDVIRGVIVLVVALLFFQHLLQIWMLYLSAIVLAFCGAIFSPAVVSIIPNIVTEDQLAKATSVDQFVFSFCPMVGMIISGFLFHWIGIFAIFILNAVSYFISGILESLIHVPLKIQTGLQKPNSILRSLQKALYELSEGYGYVKTNKVIFSLLMMNFLFNLIAFPIVMVYTPYIFNVILKAEPLQLGMTQSAVWVGVIISSFLIPLCLHRYQLKHCIWWGLLFCSLTTLIPTLIFFPQIRAGLNNWQITIFLAIVNLIAGMSVNFFTIPMYTMFQKSTSDEYRGRFWGLEQSLHNLAIGGGYFIAGYLAQKVWLGYLFWGIALGLFFIDLWAINLKAIRNSKD